MNTEVSTAAVSRVTSLELSNFKGFRGIHQLNVNADIVLIAGPNGHGKSSLLEALTLLLTGWHDPKADTVKHLIGRIPETPKGQQSVPEAHLTAIVKRGEANTAGEINWSATKQAGYADTDAKWEVKFKGMPQSRLDSPDLKARLCAFFQDRLERLFDESSNGTTLRNVFEPRPDWVQWTLEQTKFALDQLKTALQSYENEAERPSKAWVPSMHNQVCALVPHYRDLSQGGNANWPEIPDGYHSEGGWLDFVLALLKITENRSFVSDDPGLIKKFCDGLISEVKRQRLRAVQISGADLDEERGSHLKALKQKQADLVQEREALHHKFPRLQEQLKRFDASQAGLPSLLDVFQVLALDAQTWAARIGLEGDDKRFLELHRQLQAVVPEDAGKCAEVLRDWLTPRQQAQDRLQELEKDLVATELEIKELEAFVEILRLDVLKANLEQALTELVRVWEELRKSLDFERREAMREQARGYLNRRMEALKRLDLWLEELTKPNEEVMARLVDVANWALRRFSLVPGLEPFRLEREEREDGSLKTPIYRILAEDGRELVQLSTGQKAQFGIALLLAQNREVSAYLGHHVLLLDDVSTSYDLSNLVREAVLWRQLAYGAKPPFRRQIFISSHHEDMTSHLLDLLVPPQGCSLRLIRFTDWTPEKGPSFQQFEVEATAAADPSRPKDELVGFVQSIQEEELLWQTVSS